MGHEPTYRRGFTRAEAARNDMRMCNIVIGHPDIPCARFVRAPPGALANMAARGSQPVSAGIIEPPGVWHEYCCDLMVL
jgi:hypothetical protein